MAEYISREYALSCVDDFLSKTDMPIAAQFFYDCFRECEAANVQPFRHGRWITSHPVDAAKEFKCTACGGLIELPVFAKRCYYDYCPNCGARMDGEQNG